MYKFYCDDTLFYMSGIDEKEYYVIQPKLELELGKTGSFSFTLPSTNIVYNNIQKLKSIITVFDDDYELFRGRVLYDEKDFYNRKAITCEGELAFLLDSIQRAYSHQGKIEDFFNYLIENHNSQVETQKQFRVGNITVKDNNDYINRSSVNYDKTYSVITDKLINTHGGYLKTREVDGIRYIDYLEEYGEVSEQVIVFGVNLLDIKEYITAENIITCLIPLGAKQENSEERLTIKSVNGGLDYIQNQTAIELFGRIWATQEWDDITIASNLLAKGKAYLDSNIEMSVTLTLKAIDLHLINFSTERLKLGDKVRVVSLPHNIDKYFECNKITIDFQNPNNNEYTFGSSYKTLTDTSSNINNTIVNITDSIITSKIEPVKEQITAEVKDSLTQEELMNIITNNGQAEGIYLVNGQIWIKGSYVNVDKLSAIVANLGDITGGSIDINDMFIVDSQGNMTSKSGYIADWQINQTNLTSPTKSSGTMQSVSQINPYGFYNERYDSSFDVANLYTIEMNDGEISFWEKTRKSNGDYVLNQLQIMGRNINNVIYNGTTTIGNEESLVTMQSIIFNDDGGIDISAPDGEITMNGMRFGVNKVLWSGNLYMNASQIANLSEPVSSQPHGIVLVWSYYVSGEGPKNYNWNYFFVPKHHIAVTNGSGVDCMNALRGMWKYVYVHNTKIVGNNNNQGSSKHNGISTNSSNYVLRYVLGV